MVLRRYNPDTEVYYSIMISGLPDELAIAGVREISNAGSKDFFTRAGILDLFNREVEFDFDIAYEPFSLYPHVGLHHKEGRVKTRKAVDAIANYINSQGYYNVDLSLEQRLDDEGYEKEIYTVQIDGVEWAEGTPTWRYNWLNKAEGDIFSELCKIASESRLRQLSDDPTDLELWAKVLRGSLSDRSIIEVTILDRDGPIVFRLKDLISEKYPKGVLKRLSTEEIEAVMNAFGFFQQIDPEFWNKIYQGGVLIPETQDVPSQPIYSFFPGEIAIRKLKMNPLRCRRNPTFNENFRRLLDETELTPFDVAVEYGIPFHIVLSWTEETVPTTEHKEVIHDFEQSFGVDLGPLLPAPEQKPIPPVPPPQACTDCGLLLTTHPSGLCVNCRERLKKICGGCGGPKSPSAKTCLKCKKAATAAKNSKLQTKCKCGKRKSSQAEQCKNCYKKEIAQKKAKKAAEKEQEKKTYADKIIASLNRKYHQTETFFKELITSDSLLVEEVMTEMRNVFREMRELAPIIQGTTKYDRRLVNTAINIRKKLGRIQRAYYRIMIYEFGLKPVASVSGNSGKIVFHKLKKERKNYINREDFYSIASAGELLDLANSTIRKYIDKGELHKTRFGIHKDELQDFIESDAYLAAHRKPHPSLFRETELPYDFYY